MVSGQPKVPPVSVLWDLENCLPSALSPTEAGEIVRKVAVAHGRIRTIKAYWDAQNILPQEDSSMREAYFRALQLQGFDVKDCAFLGGDASIKDAILVDMCLDAVDTLYGPPPTIVVISPSNTLIEYTALMLRNKQYKVLLFHDWEQIQEAGESSTVPDNAVQTSLTITPSAPATEAPLAYTLNISDDARTRFRDLIEVLEERLRIGKNRISRADIGNTLKGRSETVYRDAGFTSSKKGFKDYLAAAENQRVIRLGGGGSEAYVELNIVGGTDGAEFGPGPSSVN